MDRGYDRALLMEKVIKMGCEFIIRAKSLDRTVYVNGEKTTLSNLARKLKGKYKYSTKGHEDLKVSYQQIRIKKREAKDLGDQTLTMIVVKGYAIDKRTLKEHIWYYSHQGRYQGKIKHYKL